MQASKLRTWLIVAITAVLGLAVGAAGVALVYQGAVIPGVVASMQQKMQQAKQKARRGPPPASVRVATVDKRTLRDRFEVVGRLEEVERTTVAAEVTGRLVAMPIEAGNRVVKDETVLGRVDDVWARLDKQSAEADVAAARATLDQSERDLRYLEDLLEANSAKPKEVQDARATVKANRAQLDGAIARRERASERVKRLTIHPPFDGVITEKHAEVGEWVSPGTPVAEMISRGKIDAVLNVPEKHIGNIAEGDSVRVRIDPIGESVTGQVVSIHPTGDNPARTFPVEVRVDDRIQRSTNQSGKQTVRLRPGMSVTGFAPLSDKAPRLVVPARAVSFGPRGAAVWLAHGGARQAGAGTQPADRAQTAKTASNPSAGNQAEGGKPPNAVRVDVEVLFATETGYAVQPIAAPNAPTLAAGHQVVIEGWERLDPGQPLKIVGIGPAEVEMPAQDKPANTENDSGNDASPTQRAGRDGEPTG